MVDRIIWSLHQSLSTNKANLFNQTPLLVKRNVQRK